MTPLYTLEVPAVDVGQSVSRVGGRAQPPGLGAAAGQLKNHYAQFLELEVFSRLGSRLEATAQRRIAWGLRAREALRQGRDEHLGWAETTTRVLLLEAAGLLGVAPHRLRDALRTACAAVRAGDAGTWALLDHGKPVDSARVDAFLAPGRAALDALAAPVPGSEVAS